MRVTVFTGNRADWGLLRPLCEAIEAHQGLELTILVSGAHLSPHFGLTATEIASEGWRTYEVESLICSDTPLGSAKSMGLGMLGVADKLQQIGTDALVVLGDRYEALGVSLAAYTMRIPIIHLQCGDVTKGSLDDGYRNCIEDLASVGCCGCQSALVRAKRRIRSVHFTGSLCCVFPRVRSTIRYDAIIVYHPTGGDSAEALRTILNSFKEEEKLLLIGSNCDPGNSLLHAVAVELTLHNVDYRASMTRDAYIAALMGCGFIIGNSSSGILEAPSLNIPTINVGDRQKGRVRANSIIDCKPKKGSIILAKKRIPMLKKSDFVNPYAKTNTLKEIVQIIENFLNN